MSALWRTDGTPQGTTRLAQDGHQLRLLAVTGSKVWFTRNVSAAAIELWSGDGTFAGSTMARTFAPSGSSNGPRDAVFLGDRLCFLAQDQGRWDAFVSDGTPAGTQALSDATFGAFNPTGLPSATAPHLATFGGAVFFASTLPSSVGRLWRSDGTRAGTVAVRDFAALQGPMFGALQDCLLFAASETATGRELWRTDGTSAGTVMLAESIAGPASGLANTEALYFVGAASKALLAATDGVAGIELFSTNGGTVTRHGDLAPGQTGSSPSSFFRVADQIYFVAEDATSGRELCRIGVREFGGALADPFGSGCAGTGGLVPALHGHLAPTVGNAEFGLELTQARGDAAMAWLLGTSVASVSLHGGCTSYLAPPVLALAGAVDAGGVARLPLPVPRLPGLIGIDLYAQSVVVDPAGAWGGVLAFSDGLRLLIGD